MLRSFEEIMGLSTLKHESERHKITLGNATLKATVSVAAAWLAHMVPFTIENPNTSLIWMAPSMKWLLAHRAVSWVKAEFCQFGTPWQKSARIAGAFLDLRAVAKHCHRKAHLCSRSGLPHVALQGQHPTSGIFMTKLAEAYPPSFACALSKVIDNGTRIVRSTAWDKACA
jgi:hypothetical protein